MIDWLPEIFRINPWGHNTYDDLYTIFCRDIRDATLKYCGHPVWMFPEKEDGKEVLFWHLTTRKQVVKAVPRRKHRFERKGTLREDSCERLPDLRRCERLPWVNPLIHNASDLKVLAWDYKEGDGVIKTYVWIKKHAFVVIMKRYMDISRRLITSFYIDKEYTRRDFERKYAAREL